MNIQKIIIDGTERFAAVIPFSLKDSLKKLIPSAKFDGKTKQWHVGIRSLKKFEVFIDAHAVEVAESEASKAAFIAKLNKMVKLTGHTFEIKDELHEKYGAIFHKEETAGIVKSAWFVDQSVAVEAQAFIDAFNVQRKKATVSEQDLKSCTSVQQTLNLIEKVIDNFEDEKYKYQDDFFYQEYLKYSDEAAFLKKLICIFNTISKYICFADETDNPGIFDLDADILKTFNIPAKFAINFYDRVFIDYKDIEKEEIDKMFSEKQYKTMDVDDISKELDGAKHRPAFHIVSKETGIEFDCTALVDIERVQSSSRVAVYHAKNIPVLNSKKFKTIAYIWWNKSRTNTFEADIA
ncbi:hypothetical protein UFOVP1367_39 [uncultured Caudovirales phage]|uniref:Uncharacterized protein n=1 Tax=uncultured Caudovirales phage TaxID=2100421 RepID=A0A6J5S3V2_9CAUD|nr:hypothetical protein KNT69_gp39 [uncultured Caudovirales phage]CAB4202800.1 hypothetical protein UFOVP1367_39 [uncultured Caudovirales phage]